MTLDEYIKYVEKIAEKKEKEADFHKDLLYHHYDEYKCQTEIDKCEKCAKEHRQLAEWLKDYKRLQAAIEDIKAEIEKLNPVDYSFISPYKCHNGASEMQEDVLEIIDKHTSGKE